jgi:hypothetical protein
MTELAAAAKDKLEFEDTFMAKIESTDNPVPPNITDDPDDDGIASPDDKDENDDDADEVRDAALMMRTSEGFFNTCP